MEEADEGWLMITDQDRCE